MTSGAQLGGDNANLGSTRFRYKKYWSGSDGKYVTGQVKQLQWNNYTMARLHYKSEGSDLGLIDKASGVYQVVNNSVMSAPDNFVVSASFPTSTFNTYWDAQKELKLLAKLLGKVKNHSLDLGVAMAEVDKLAGTIVGTVKTIAFAVNDLSRGNFAAAARRLGTSPPSAKKVQKLRTLDISGRFLEMKYAWEPTINDAFETVQAFEAISNGPRKTLFKASDFIGVSIPYDGNYRRMDLRLKCQRSYTYELYEELSALRQVGLANPLSIVWERLPWSFVLDWFIPIGSYLELIGQIPFLKGRWMRTDVVEILPSLLLPELTAGVAQYNRIAQPIPHVELSAFYMQRTVTSGPPSVPLPNFHKDGGLSLGSPKPSKRLWNALALAHQIFFKAERNTSVTYHL